MMTLCQIQRVMGIQQRWESGKRRSSQGDYTAHDNGGVDGDVDGDVDGGVDGDGDVEDEIWKTRC